MDFETKTATFEILKDMERIFGLLQQLLQRDGRFLDKYTDEIDELITDFMDFWAIASYWVKEKLGLTVEEEDENEEEMEVDQASIEDRSEVQTRRGGYKQDSMGCAGGCKGLKTLFWSSSSSGLGSSSVLFALCLKCN